MSTKKKGKAAEEQKPTERTTDKKNKEYLEKVCDEIMVFKKEDVMI